MKFFDEITRFGFLPALVAGFSIFSLVTRTFDLGLSVVFAEMITFYTKLGNWFFGWTKIFGFSVPAWYIDLFLLSGVGAGIHARAIFDPYAKNKTQDENDTIERWVTFAAKLTGQLILAITLLGLQGWIMSAVAVISPEVFTPEGGKKMNKKLGLPTKKETVLTKDTPRRIRQELFFTLCIVIFVFAANAYGLSGASS